MNNKNYILIKIASLFIIVAIIILLSLYFLTFRDGLSTHSSDWGNFGDFIGGISMLLLTSLNVLIFYQLTKQMREDNDSNANKQQKIESLVIHSELQRFLYSRIVEKSDSIIKGNEDLKNTLVHVKQLYFFLQWANFTKVFSEECENKRCEICAIIRPIVGIDENGMNVEATKQEDDDAWDDLRGKINVLEVFVNKAMMDMVDSLSKAQE